MQALGRGKGQRMDSLGYTRDSFFKDEAGNTIVCRMHQKLDKEMRLLEPHFLCPQFAINRRLKLVVVY